MTRVGDALVELLFAPARWLGRIAEWLTRCDDCHCECRR